MTRRRSSEGLLQGTRCNSQGAPNVRDRPLTRWRKSEGPVVGHQVPWHRTAVAALSSERQGAVGLAALSQAQNDELPHA